MKMQWTVLIALLFALLTAVFAVINVAPVQVNYMFGEASIPLILVILGSVLLGGLIIGCFSLVREYKLQRRIRALEKQLDAQSQLQKEPQSPALPETAKPSAEPSEPVEE
ncbi:LapA family protein [Paenibacillus sp. y28]|uniref:LapA family protein n=1 Tax=Paenibacillus sp. y28 TaxID=3129110 RepID=UPI003017A98B